MALQCSFCKGTRWQPIATKASLLTGEEVEYYRCRDCGSIRQDPFPKPDVLDAYYQNYPVIKACLNPGYLNKNAYAQLVRERDMTLREIGFPLNRLKGTTNVELGCANGLFLRYLYERGARNIIGLDVSEPLLEQIQDPHVTVKKGGLEQLSPHSVDNLFLFNILEHIPDIDLLMTQMVQVLTENSLVVIEVPVAGLISRAFGERWRFLLPDEHLAIPSVGGLKMLLRRYGFTIIGATRFGSGFTTGNLPRLLKAGTDQTAKLFFLGDRLAILVCKKSNIPRK